MAPRGAGRIDISAMLNGNGYRRPKGSGVCRALAGTDNPQGLRVSYNETGVQLQFNRETSGVKLTAEEARRLADLLNDYADKSEDE